MDNKLKSLVKEIKFKRDWNTQQVAKSIDYSREYLTTEMNKEEGNAELEKLLLEKHADILQTVNLNSQEGEHSYKKDQDLTMQALVNLTESNRMQAESLRTMTSSHRELVMMVKQKNGFTDGADARTQLELLGTVLGMRTLLEELAVKVNKQSLSEVQDSLDKIVKEKIQNFEHTDSTAVVDK